ncbi:ABC transporter permease [Candidatus Pacearchaeota archaeon]|nr:ABC transporter permease [Candidatus Pacearchaeota archaeon]
MIRKEIINYSLRNLVHKKSRSILTIFSILIGITAIFIFISFGLGLYNYVNDFKTSSSADKITVMPKGMSAPGMDESFALTDKDISAIEKTSGVYQATGLYSKVAEVKQSSIIRYVFLLGFDPDKPLIMELSNVKVIEGRMLKSGDDGKVILGYNYRIENKIFSKAYSLNDEIEIQGKKLKIIGFMQEVGSPQDDSQIYTTTDFLPSLYPVAKVNYAMAVARVDISNIKQVVENVEKELRKERGLEEGKEDFFVQSFQEMLDTYATALNVIIYFVVLIALVSVIVSAINTANTMVTSVLERVKEIGVIKSIGARNSEIFFIFLFESGFLGFVGGVIGVIIGFNFTLVTGAFLAKLGWSFLAPSYSVYLFLGCILFATLTGAISGAVPAYQASKIRPVDALRYE